jgi:hypothetical protein
MNRKGDTRISTLLSHINPARARKNLDIRPNCVVDHLYLVDASVFPAVPSAVPNLTVMMLGERIAGWLSGTVH